MWRRQRGRPAAASSLEALPPTVGRHVPRRRPRCPRWLGAEPAAGVEAARSGLTLAKRLHPDKADHPQAAQAFAAVESVADCSRDVRKVLLTMLVSRPARVTKI